MNVKKYVWVLIINLLIICALIIAVYCYNYKPLHKTTNPKIIIANTGGSNSLSGSGLGNQFFIFAYSYAFAKKIDATQIFIKNLSSCEKESEDFKNISKRCYGLHKFGIHYPIIQNLDDFKKEHNEQKIYEIDNLNLFKKNKSFFNEYDIFIIQPMFQSKRMVSVWKKYKHEIKHLFNYQDPLSDAAQTILHEIQNSNSVSVHVRRSDFIPLNRDFPMSYHIKAMYLMTTKVKNPTFYIFSDDPKFSQEYFTNKDHIKKDLNGIKTKQKYLDEFYSKLENAVYVSNKIHHSLEEFHLMSQSKHNIITNSTFSWWAAFLNKNPNKIVIAPLNPPKEQAHPNPPNDEGWLQIN